MTKIGIIILNWNQPDLTLKTITSLQKTSHKNFQFKIYLIDNGSTDKSFDTFITHYRNPKQIVLLKTNSNLGFVGGNNFALKIALKENFDYYLLLNNDVQVDPDFLKNLLDYSIKYPDVGLLAPKIYFAPGFEYQKNYSKKDRGNVIWFAGGKIDWNNIYCSHRGIDEIDKGQYDKPSQSVDYLTGCCLLIKSDVVKKAGLLNEKYYLYLEDAEYCVRALKHDFKIAYVPSSRIWHYNSGSSSAGGDLHHYFITRNRLLFGFTYASLKTKFALFKDSLKIYFSSPSQWQKRGVLDFYLDNFGKGSWK